MQPKPSRREQILEALARELEERPGARITTARLAAVVGVSEAALYRHFPSKAKMFEALIAFAEEEVFGRVNRILAEEDETAVRIERVLALVLTFSSRNPGITRVLLGEALVGEHERLRARVAQFFDRLETQLRQILREAPDAAAAVRGRASAAANLLSAAVQGRMLQFGRGGFAHPPTEHWDQQWELLRAAVLETGTGA